MEKLESLAQVVADYFDIPLSDLRGRSGIDTLMYPRQLFCYLATEFLHNKHREVGKFLNGRDRSTVTVAKLRVEDWLKVDKITQRHINALSTLILKSDSSFLLKEILETTPTREIPGLLQKLGEWKSKLSGNTHQKKGAGSIF